jgi:hypothetical protein
MHVFCAVLIVAILGRPLLVDTLSVPVLQTAATVFVAVCVQALPFLVLGVLLSGCAGSSPHGRRRPSRWPVPPGSCSPAASARRCRWPGG